MLAYWECAATADFKKRSGFTAGEREAWNKLSLLCDDTVIFIALWGFPLSALRNEAGAGEMVRG